MTASDCSIEFSAHKFLDRKSTRLNSSHGYISYAVFCLKKKKPILHQTQRVNGQHLGIRNNRIARHEIVAFEVRESQIGGPHSFHRDVQKARRVYTRPRG